MSVHEHKAHAPSGPFDVHLVVVSTSRSAEEDETGPLLAELLEGAGHRVLARRIVPDDVELIREALQDVARERKAQVAIFTGGTGISRSDRTPEALRPLFDREITGFGELFRFLSWQEVGSAAMLSRACAGMIGPLLVFALPGSKNACRTAMEKLVLPELGHLVREVRKEGPPANGEPSRSMDAAQQVAEQDAAVAPSEEEPEDAEDALPPPSGSLGRLGSRSVAVAARESAEAEASTGEEAEGPSLGSGWKRALYEIGGELVLEKREEVPVAIEKLAPVTNVLDTAGEQGVVRLPSGVRYGAYGWPDLQRPSSKVLLVGWGEPLAEVVALHRYPVLTGVCIGEDRGLVCNRRADIASTCEQVTGRAPKDTSGELFAVQGDKVWIQRGNRVVCWDGRKEREDGNPKQVLASLVLRWSGR